MSIFQLLIQFVFRLTFGVALAMGITSSRCVSSGFFRVHLWVLMALNTLASLAIWTQRESLGTNRLHIPLLMTLAVGLAALSYLGSIMWLYEKAGFGNATLFVIALAGLAAASLAMPFPGDTTATAAILVVLDIVSSGLLLGATLCAMFLGHWYLNTPTMELLPLKRLVLLMGAAILARVLVSGAGLCLQIQTAAPGEAMFWIFVALRWLSGLLATSLLAVMTWYALKIPNTQSATGILYAGVILTFIGELTSQFLSVDALYPL